MASGQAIQAGAEGRHGRGVCIRQGEAGLDRLRPRHEQADRLERQQVRRWHGTAGSGKRQRRDREVVLAGEAEDVAAGDEH